MKFKKAFKKAEDMACDKRLRRKAWPKGHYVHMYGTAQRYLHIGSGVYAHLDVNVTEFLDEDWEIVE